MREPRVWGSCRRQRQQDSMGCRARCSTCSFFGRHLFVVIARHVCSLATENGGLDHQPPFRFSSHNADDADLDCPTRCSPHTVYTLLLYTPPWPPSTTTNPSSTSAHHNLGSTTGLARSCTPSSSSDPRTGSPCGGGGGTAGRRRARQRRSSAARAHSSHRAPMTAATTV